MVHLVLHTHGIEPTFFKFDSWSPEAGFISIISTKGINQIKKGKLYKKNFSFMHTKRFNTLFKDGFNSVWVQFNVYHFNLFFIENQMLKYTFNIILGL